MAGIWRRVQPDMPGTPLVHIVCGRCGKRVARVEIDEEDNSTVTLWQGWRHQGVPDVECADHGRLDLDKLHQRMAEASSKRRPVILRARPVR